MYKSEKEHFLFNSQSGDRLYYIYISFCISFCISLWRPFRDFNQFSSVTKQKRGRIIINCFSRVLVVLEGCSARAGATRRATIIVRFAGRTSPTEP